MQLPRQRDPLAIEGFAPTHPAASRACLPPAAAPVGAYCRVGSDWAVKVVGSLVNAEREISRNNRFTPKPRPGYQYVLVEMTAKKLSGEGDAYVELEPRLYAEASDTTYDECLEVVPEPLVAADEQYGLTSGAVCFEVKSSDVHTGDLELLVTEAPAFDAEPKAFRLS